MIIEEKEADKKENLPKKKGLLSKINSKYIIKQISEILYKGSLLNIIRYNKALQKELEIELKDFKEFSELYSPIEFELIPASNIYGKFINLADKEHKYCHIYFNDNKEEEIYKYSLDEEEDKDKIKKIRIILDYKIDSFNDLFEGCKCIESIKVKKFNRINIDNMRGMFWECTALKEIELQKFKTNEVTNMSWMFFNCKDLKKADISKFKLDNVEKAVGMFWGCASLDEINLPGFNNIDNIDMKCMFSECSEQLKQNVRTQNNNISNIAFN